MFEKNSGLKAILYGALVLLGFGLAWVTKPIPEAEVHMTVHGLFVNGKHVDLDQLKIKLPIQPDRKKKDGALPKGDLGPVASVDCPCGESCNCNPCHCHAAKAISFIDGQDDTPVVSQRGGPQPQILGIESLVAILREFKEAIFGSNGKPGLRDDIAGGLRDFYSEVRTGVIVAGGTLAGFMLWVGINLQRIADKA